MEFAEVELTDRRMKATGVAIGSAPVIYRLDYVFETRSRFIHERLVVVSRGQGWRRSLELQLDRYGTWRAETDAEGELDLPPPGGDMSQFSKAEDCDIALSPLTNTMPVLRHGLLEGGGPVDFTMAWISVPDLSVHASRQRYTFVRKEGDVSVVRYESITRDFVAELRFDADGLVIDYPGIGRRI